MKTTIVSVSLLCLSTLPFSPAPVLAPQSVWAQSDSPGGNNLPPSQPTENSAGSSLPSGEQANHRFKLASGLLGILTSVEVKDSSGHVTTFTNDDALKAFCQSYSQSSLCKGNAE